MKLVRLGGSAHGLVTKTVHKTLPGSIAGVWGMKPPRPTHPRQPLNLLAVTFYQETTYELLML